jgi:hypothetical protein
MVKHFVMLIACCVIICCVRRDRVAQDPIKNDDESSSSVVFPDDADRRVTIDGQTCGDHYDDDIIMLMLRRDYHANKHLLSLRLIELLFTLWFVSMTPYLSGHYSLLTDLQNGESD